MTELIPYLVGFAVILAIPAALCFYAARKAYAYDRVFLLLLGFCFLLFGMLPLTGAFLESTALLAFGFMFPGGVMITAIPISVMLRYRRCTEPVRAKCTRYLIGGRYRETRIPVFCYRFQGETLEESSFLSYPVKQYERLFEKGGIYTIYLDPKAPKVCADKREFPKTGNLALLILGAVCLLLSVILPLCLS